MEDNSHNRIMRRSADDEVPVCTRCFTPIDPLKHYCPNCGEATGRFTPYIPFVNIRHNYGLHSLQWRVIWNKNTSWPVRIMTLLAVLVLFGPILVLALPFVIAEKIRTRRCEYRNALDSRSKNP